MKRIFSFLGLLILAGHISGQKDPDFQKEFYDGHYYLLYNDYEHALPFFLNLSEKHSTNANVNYITGLCYMYLPGMKVHAIPYLERAIRNTTSRYRTNMHKERRAPHEAVFMLGIAYRAGQQFDKAIEQMKRYKDLLRNKPAEVAKADHEIICCQTAQEMIKNPVKPLIADTVPLADAGDFLYNPCVSLNGKVMAFMSRKKYYSAIYISTWRNGWSAPVNITAEIESDGNHECVSLSPDGNTLFLTNRGSENQDIFTSEFRNGRWSRLSAVKGQVNTRANETHAFLSPDGQYLYFSSDRSGGYGNLDLYRAVKDTGNYWGAPENLGSTINTGFNETSACLPHGETLYFSSEGHRNMGGYDIFMTKWSTDGWSKPVNTGYPVSTTDDDLYYSPLPDKHMAYMSTFLHRENITNSSIVELNFSGEPRPVIVHVNGTVQLPEDMKDVPVSITVTREGITDTVMVISPVKGTGMYDLYLPEGRYTFVFESHETEKRSEPFVFSSRERGREFNSMVKLERRTVPVQQPFILKSIYFSFDKYQLPEGALVDLDSLVSFLCRNRGVVLLVEGHTDAVGSEEYNEKLSRLRAEEVFKYLTDKGVESGQLRIRYYGEKRPVAQNVRADGSDYPEGRKYNRRVDFSVAESSGLWIKPEDIDIPEPVRIR